MRPDFYRVVTESPRRGSGSKNRSTRFHLSGKSYNPDIHDDLPTRESMCHRNRIGGWDWKDFTDVLGPIYGFLRSRVGRFWNDVYSEIRNVISPSASEPIRHIWSAHFIGAVTINCFLEDGKVYEYAKYLGKREVDGFYVHPGTHRLEYRSPAPRLKYKQKFIGKNFPVIAWKDPDTGQSVEQSALVVKIDHVTRAEKIKGLWHLFCYRERTEEERKIRDFLGRVTGTLPPLQFLNQKQASKKDLKNLGLKNDPPRI